MKVKFWTYIINGGDGSASVAFFINRKQAEKYKRQLDKDMGEESWAEDCIDPHELEFDDNGNLLNPDKYEF